MKYLRIGMYSYEFLDHIHVADEIVYNPFQVFAGLVRRIAVSAAQEVIHKISVKDTAGCRLYGIIVSVQFHIRISFLLTTQKCPETISEVCGKGYIFIS